LVDSLLSVGIQPTLGRTTLSHFYSLLINKQSTLLLKTMIKLSIVTNLMALDSVMVQTSMLVTTRIVTLAVMSTVVVHTTSQ
jgi:hypothetical protein